MLAMLTIAPPCPSRCGMRGVDGVKRGEEIGLHGALISFERLVLHRADFDDAGVIDQHIERTECAQRLVDQAGGLVRVGKIADHQQDVVFVRHIAGVEQLVPGEFEFLCVTGGQNQLQTGASEAMRERESKPARAAGDDGDLA